MAFTTDPIFVVNEICEIPVTALPPEIRDITDKVGRAFMGKEAACSSNTKYFLIVAKETIVPADLERLRQALREQTQCLPLPSGKPE